MKDDNSLSLIVLPREESPVLQSESSTERSISPPESTLRELLLSEWPSMTTVWQRGHQIMYLLWINLPSTIQPLPLQNFDLKTILSYLWTSGPLTRAPRSICSQAVPVTVHSWTSKNPPYVFEFLSWRIKEHSWLVDLVTCIPILLPKLVIALNSIPEAAILLACTLAPSFPPWLVMASDDKTPLNDTDSKPDYSTIFGEKKEEFAKQTVFGEVCLS